MNQNRSRRGVTMLELIIVIGLLLILAALLIPAVAKVRQAAGRTQSANLLKMLGLAVHNHASVHRAAMPIFGKVNNQDGSVMFHLLPYMEYDNVYREAKGNGWSVANRTIPGYLDPDDKSLPDHLFQNALATTSYVCNWQICNGKYNIGNLPDGTSNTLLFTTRYELCNGTPNVWAYSALSPWTPMFGYYTVAKFQVSPKQQDCDPQVPQSMGSVILVGLGDGSVRSVDAHISPRTWYHVIDPADGNVLDNDW